MQHNHRLDILLSHLFPSPTSSESNENYLKINSCSGQLNQDLSCAKCTAFSSTQFKEEMMNRYYTPEQIKIRQDIYDLVRDNPLFERKYGITKEEERQLSHDRAVYIIQKLRPFELEHFKTDPKRFFSFLDAMNNIDIGATGRCMIHFGLFGGSILYFGTEKHKQFQDRVVNDFGKIFGMFCMSEIGHASNVQQIETLAIYDHQSKTINIRTPSDNAIKVWSGGAAQFAQWAVVFAQLVIDKKKCGVHAFLVPIRSEKDHSILPGIRIRDLGSKIGLNSLDNGRVWFDVKISKDLMLDRFGTIDENGQYKTSIPDESMRFLAHVQALLIGRIMTASSSLNALKMALEITLKYAVHRRQFGPTNGEELQIINYLSYQRRLYPHLAFCFVSNFSVEDLKSKYETNSDSKMIHTLASCLKAKCSDIALMGCQECRKASGAQGFLSANRIGEMRDISDASITYEGDNNVLYQTASRNLVRRNTKIPSLEKLTSIQDLAQLQKLFEFREANIEKQYREKLGKLLKTLPPFDAANKTQDLALKLGNAYIENNIIKIFLQEALGKLSERNKNLTEMFTRLALLLIYTWIQQDGFFLLHDLISKEQYSQLDESINSICQYLTPFIPTLVNSFGFPSFLTNVIMGPKLVENMAYEKIYN